MKEFYIEEKSHSCEIGENCFIGTQVRTFSFPEKDQDIDSFTMKVKNCQISDNEVFSTLYNNEKFIKENGCVYTNDMTQLVDAERNVEEAKVNSKCHTISNFAFNIKTLKKVKFDDKCELQKFHLLHFLNHKSII